MTTPPLNPLISKFKQAQDSGVAPLDPVISMPSYAPALSAPISPTVTRTPRASEIAQQNYSDIAAKPAGVDSVSNPILKGIARVGDITASIFAPRVAQFIPGTTLNHERQVGIAAQRAQQAEAQDKSQADIEQADADARKAATEAAGLPQRQQDLHDVSQAQIGDLNSEKNARNNPIPKPKSIEEQAFDYAISQGKNPLDALTSVYGSKNTKDAGLPQQYLDAIASGDETKAALIRRVINDTSTAPRLQVINATAANSGSRSQDAQTQKEYAAAAKDLGSQFSTAQTQAETLATARQEINSGAIGQAAGTIKTLVGLAGGKGTGVRITQAELNAIAHARGIQGDFEGAINRLQGKGSLSPDQVRQMDALLGDVENKIREKMAIQDEYLDRLSSAGSAQEIRQIQSEYRKDLLGGGKSSVTPPAGANVRDYTSLGGK